MDRRARSERCEIEPDAARAFSLPAHAYLERGVAALERERLFARAWIHVGHVAELAQPGDCLTAEVAGAPILVLRDRDGGLRAFHNACRHLGCRLVATGGRLETGVECHACGLGWRFDGALAAAGPYAGSPSLDAAALALSPARVAVAAGLAFVALDLTAQPSHRGLKALGDAALDALPDLARFRRVTARRIEAAADWKIIAEMFLAGRPTAAIDGFSAWRVGPSDGFGAPRDAAEAAGAATAWTLWPALRLLRLDDSAHLIALRAEPAGDAPRRTVVDAVVYARDGQLTPALAPRLERLFKSMSREDATLAAGRQAAREGGSFAQGRYAVDPGARFCAERARHQFHRAVLAAIQNQDQDQNKDPDQRAPRPVE